MTGRVLLAGTVDEVPGVWQLLAANDSVPELLFSSDSGGFTQATWSPDRTRIAVTLEPEDKAKQSSVMVMDADGGNRRIISPDFIESSDPAWTRDGTALLFALREGKVSTIVRVPVAGGKPDTLVQVMEGRLRSPRARQRQRRSVRAARERQRDGPGARAGRQSADAHDQRSRAKSCSPRYAMDGCCSRWIRQDAHVRARCSG